LVRLKTVRGMPATVNTGKSGTYTFANLAPGFYQISETPPAGYTHSAPSGGVYTLTVLAGQTLLNQSFGNKAS